MNKIRYSTNWMGPVSMHWYQERGLVETKMVTLEHDSVIIGRKAGDQYEVEEITTHYSCGRIDVMGIGVAPRAVVDCGDALAAPAYRGAIGSGVLGMHPPALGSLSHV